MPRRLETGLNIAYNTSKVEEEKFLFSDLVEYWESGQQPSYGTVITEQVARQCRQQILDANLQSFSLPPLQAGTVVQVIENGLLQLPLPKSGCS